MSHIRNIVYIHTHDMGRHISPYGYDAPTPALQAFASQATLFRNAYCCGPTCSPSRAGLLTGVTPHQSGMLGLAHRGFRLTNPEQHLASFLREHGFLTALCGKQHEFDSAWNQLPYERLHIEETLAGHAPTDQLWTDAAVSFLHEKHDRPFFLSHGLFYPHRAFAHADQDTYPTDQIQVPSPLPDTPETRRDMADYLHSVHLADNCIGQVLDAIQTTGRARDTLVIVTTDHGIAFPGMKCNLTDHGIGVTLMMAYPGNPSAGQSTDALVSQIDVYPTVCDLLGLAPPPHLQGHSIRPVMERTVPEIRDEIFSEVSFHAAYEPMRCVRTQRYKLIRRFNAHRRELANCDDSPSKEVMLARGWGEETLPALTLHDLLIDPLEEHNLADDPTYSAVRQDLENRLRCWMTKTHDPLLLGPVPAPAEADIVRDEEPIKIGC